MAQNFAKQNVPEGTENNFVPDDESVGTDVDIDMDSDGELEPVPTKKQPARARILPTTERKVAKPEVRVVKAQIHKAPAPVDKTVQSTASAINKLKLFLDDYKSKEKGQFTHTWMGYPKASYDVPVEQLPKLFELLHHRMFVDNKEAHLTEKPCNPSNIKIDLDFRYDMDVNKRQHSHEHIVEIIQLYNQVITEYLEVSESRLNAYVFERRCGYKLKGYTRDGVHIMYPDIVAPVEAQHAIRKRILELCEPVLSKLPLRNSNDEVIDRGVIGDNNWLVYGCTKPNLPRYQLTAIYDHQLEQIPITNDHLALMRHLSNFNPDKEQFVVKVRPDKHTEIEYLDQHRRAKPKTTQATIDAVKRSYLDRDGEVSLDDVKKLIHMLSPYRSEGYFDWIQVGWCLHNIDHSLLQEWIEFSKLSEKYQAGECEKIWESCRDEGYGIAALNRWAKQDSPDEYEKFWRNRIFNYIEQALSGATFDVATVLHQMFRYRYVCAVYKHNIWYEFKNHRWIEIDSGESLRGRLSNEVLNEFCRLNVYYNQSAIGEKDSHKNQFIVKSDQLNDVSLKLRDVKFKDKVIDEARNLFYDRKFSEKLDQNPDLIGFNNGVYDLKLGLFRDGRPEDYVSMTTGNDFVEYDGKEPEINEVYDFMSKLFPIERVRDYMFILLSSFLLGSNPDEKFHVWTGTASNGKSKLLELFEMAFGQYCAKLPISLLTQKRAASNSASPELARTIGTRFVSLQEPDEHERMNIGLMKELTGGDKIQSRQLYREPVEFKPQFKMVLCCNHLPKVPPNDDGTWRRLRVTDFIAKFVDEPDPNVPYQFKKDPHLADKFISWKTAFMYILLEHHKIYRTNGMKIIEPPEVKAATKEYQKMSDVFVEFREEHLEQKPEGSVKLEEAFARFRIWYKANYDAKVPARRDFKDNMEKHLGNKYNPRSGWIGWSFIEEINELDVVDEITENPVPAITPAQFRSDVVPPKTSQVTPHLVMQKSTIADRLDRQVSKSEAIPAKPETPATTPKLVVTPKVKKV
jgi:P4 family phage/plasmid primase-like protien